MSWSTTYIGTPENIVQALKKQSDSLSGKSKEEFDAAVPHMAGLLLQNYNKTTAPTMKLTAAGHGHDGYCNCSVNIENIGSVIV